MEHGKKHYFGGNPDHMLGIWLQLGGGQVILTFCGIMFTRL